MIQCDRRISEILGEAKLLEGGDDDDDLDGEPEDNGGMRKRPKKSKRKKRLRIEMDQARQKLHEKMNYQQNPELCKHKMLSTLA